jgi:hypothetical protein
MLAPENKSFWFMKWQKHLMVVLFISSILAACSSGGDDSNTTEAATTTNTPPASPTETLKSDAKEKRSDAVAQRLKSNVQTMSESVYPGDNTKNLAFKNVFKYDKNGNRLELSSYKSDGGLVSTIKSLYDSSGKVAAEETVLANGVVDIKTTIKTDENGNRVEQNDIKQGGGGNLFNYKYIYRYDAQAHMIERVGYRGNGTFFLKYNFTYDANGNRTEWLQLTQTNQLISKVTYKYDDKNNIIEETKYQADNTVKEAFTYTYEFDKKGNWTKQKKLQNGNVVETRVREYKYY